MEQQCFGGAGDNSVACVCVREACGCLSGRAVWSWFIGSSQSYGSAKANTLPLSVSLHIAALFPFFLFDVHCKYVVIL